MTSTLISMLVFAGVSLLLIGLASLFYELYFRYRRGLRARIQQEFGMRDDSSPLLTSLPESASGMRARWSAWLAQLLDQSGVDLTLYQFAGLCVTSGLTAGLAASLLTGAVLPFLLAVPFGAAAPLLFVMSRRNWRLKKLCEQLPEAFEAMGRAVRSGQTAPAAMRIVGENFPDPISQEFGYCSQQQLLGVSPETALKDMARRAGVMELQIFVLALLVQSRSGGNLTELLEKLAAIVRNRLKLQAKIKAMTSEGRMQALVLTLLPLAALIALVVLSPEYVSVLFARPWILAATLCSQIAGAVWIRCIVHAEV
ncbi:type II secretion system F family protein [Lignipirellula cremea]|uniref:Bacterial type II secretion system protein F domain protein n=1 Tax=Lignipirellula cremea TaxID=2528010 RepID=A0A518DM86_9BACT|nr:type II secretion system F family protein [Lignipirellula cremea]QDU92932.1 Bacterial type II secretion system protein F domain protein [Lignipirellula cremea]